jgi:hypothetical protein
MPPELEAIECPEEMLYVWEYFRGMCARRQHNGRNFEPLSNTEIEAWARLRGVRLTPSEVQAIDELEMMYLLKKAEQARREYERWQDQAKTRT